MVAAPCMACLRRAGFSARTPQTRIGAPKKAGINAVVRLDTSRVIAGIVGGIGFLGAGAIIQSRGRIQGMTTASGIWMTAAIGVSVGLGMYVLSLAATFLAFVVLVLLRRSFEGEEDSE